MPDSPANPPRESALKPGHALALVYAALFVSGGFYLPFFPVFLKDAGFSSEAIGIAIGLPMAIRLFANPAAGVLSDRWSRPRRFLAILGLGAGACFVLMSVLPGPAAIFILLALAVVFWGPAFPLTDAFGIRLSREKGIDYGRARLWGSVSFIAANLVLGAALEAVAPGTIVWFIAASLFAFAASAMLMPRLERPNADLKEKRVPLGARLFLGVAAAACVQASHAPLYAFGSIHWSTIGISPAAIGFLWAIGVFTEVIVFYFGTIALARYSALGLILIGGFSSVVRFAFTALDPPQSVLIVLQMMHALTFTATFLGMVSLAGMSATAGTQGRAQTFASAAVSIAMLIATFAAGPLYAAFGAAAFFGSAAIGALGVALAGAAMLQPQSSRAGGKTVEPS